MDSKVLMMLAEGIEDGRGGEELRDGCVVCT